MDGMRACCLVRGQDARGEALVRGVNCVPDSFDASEYEDNGVAVESARGEALVRGVNSSLLSCFWQVQSAYVHSSLLSCF
jgi:hypothetical protein